MAGDQPFLQSMSLAVSKQKDLEDYYDWREREEAGPTDRQIAEEELVALIGELWSQADGNYGCAADVQGAAQERPRCEREEGQGGD